ncbi:MAG: sulfatase-like hydrolase/transferase [Leptospiraceae bacterium]|nr:sulfatase-like hydrolase/transferase [Leptospiraceae bacterium]
MGVFIALQSCFRLIFTLIYAYRLEDTGLDVLLRAFLIGLRFDIAAAATILMPFFVLSWIEILNRFTWYRRLWATGPLVLIVWLIAHESADLIYFENANKHLGYEGFAFLGDISLLLKSAFYQNPGIVLGAAIALLAAMAGMYFIYRRFLQSYDYPRGNNYRIIIPRLILFLIVSIILMRGGLQDRILRPSTALISENDFANNIGLNPVFTMLVDLRSYSIPKDKQMDMEEALWLTRREIAYPGARFVSEEFPLLRKTVVKSKPAKKPNVIILLMENWTGKFVQPISDGLVAGKEVTPFFNQFYKRGRFYDHFMASGGRTVNGLLGILTGMPDKPGLTVFRSQHIFNTFRPLPQILKEDGYDTYFVTGGPLEFTNKKQILPSWGFDTLIGMQYMDALQRYERDKKGWGYFDEDIYEVFHETLRDRPNPDKPFLAVFESLSTHYPYDTPDKRFNIFDPQTRDFEFLNSYHYSDWALGQYLQQALQSDYGRDTVFLIMGDHTHHRYLNYYEDRNIPLLIYWPGKIKPSVDSRISSQLDIVPTLLGLLGVDTYFAALGKDLLDPGARRSAYFAHGNIFGWIEDATFYYQLTDAKFGFGRITEESLYTIPTCTQDGGGCDYYRRKGIAFLNAAIRLIDEKRVFPKDKASLQAALAQSQNQTIRGCNLALQEHYALLEKRAIEFDKLANHVQQYKSPRPLQSFLPPEHQTRQEAQALYQKIEAQENEIQTQIDKRLADARQTLAGNIHFDPAVEREPRIQNIQISAQKNSAEVATQMFTLILNNGDRRKVKEREELLRQAARLNKMDLPPETLAELEQAPKLTPVQQQVSIKLTRWRIGSDCNWYPVLDADP